MKRLLLSLTVVFLASQAMADIQDPPMRSYNAGRKFGRGLANFLYSGSEIADSMDRINELDGNAAGFTYGFFRGIGRCVTRMGVGAFEVVTFPFPTNRRSYRPIMKSNIPWVNSGYEEFPPEWGFQARKNYTTGYFRY